MRGLLTGLAKVLGLVLVMVAALVTVAALVLAWVGIESNRGPDLATGQVPVLLPEVVAEHPRSPDAFTQGLELTPDGRLLESTGGYGTSVIRLVQIDDDSAGTSIELPTDHFGEGVTLVHEGGDVHAVQLTWKAGLAHRWALTDDGGLHHAGQYTYEGQGWGLCHDELHDVLWRSDGSNVLTAHDPDTFAETGTYVEVVLGEEPVTNLNELECTAGSVLANVWHSDDVMLIDQTSGEVMATLDASSLTRRAEQLAGGELGREEVLNGIAHDPATDRWYLTGKNWPVLFEVELVAADDD